MEQETQRRLAESLTGESVDIIPYLPYLLQDFWSLASEPDDMIHLLQSNTDFSSSSRLLDLACGKGISSIRIAQAFACTAKGVDLIPEFIAEAREKAAEYGVADLCDFEVADVNEAVLSEHDYDLTIWCGAGDLLGGYAHTLEGIVRTIKEGGYLLLDEGYLPDEQRDLRFHHDYLTKSQWDQAFKENNLTVVACKETEPEIDPLEYEEDLLKICKRARELRQRYPEKKELFDTYVKDQQAEYEDLQDGVVATMWLLQKKCPTEALS